MSGGNQKKEVMHPLLPERVPYYDLVPIADLILSASRRIRIHRGMADPRLLLIPRS